MARVIAGWGFWGVVLAMSFLSSPSVAQEAASDAAVEPPLEFVLNVGGKDMPVRLDEPFELEGGDGKQVLTLSVGDTRLFDKSGIKFRYPRHFAFEADLEDPTFQGWTLDGNSTVMMLFLAPDTDDAATMRDDFVETMVEQFGEEQTSVSKTSISLEDEAVSGSRIEALIADVTLRQDIFGLATPEGALILVIQDTLEDDGSPTKETAGAIELLKETFKVENTKSQ